jgi:sugar lactone lactonase YvrE
MNPSVTCIFDQPALLGESPLWHPQEKKLYWVDIEKKAIHRLDPTTQQHHTWPMPTEIGCIAMSAKDGLMGALRYGFARINLSSEEVCMLQTPITALDGVMFNDGKCDRAGRFWAGTKDILEQSNIGALYRLDASLQCKEMARGFAVSNGFAWSPDNKYFYVCNSPERMIYQYDFDLKTGSISSPIIFAKLSEDSGYPDGLTVDSEGGLWNAHWDGWCITRYLPNGKIDRIIEMPVQRPTSCCFGGPDFKTLYVTSASTRLSAEELKQNPLAGCMFAVEVGVKGLPEPMYAG